MWARRLFVALVLAGWFYIVWQIAVWQGVHSA